MKTSITPSPAGPLLDALERMGPTVREHSRRAEADRQLSEPVLSALREAGFYRMFRPVEMGGFGLDPVSEFTVAEELARLDSAAAWNVQVCNASELYGAWFSADAARAVFGCPTAIVAGSFSPRRRAVATDGGYLISGSTPFNSNSHGADWFVGLADVHDGDRLRTDADGLPITLLTAVAAGECRIVENWNTLGLGGTGSHDVEISNAFVPESRAVRFGPLTSPPPNYDNALSRMAVWATAGAHAAVAVGIARAAVEDLITLGAKVPTFTEQALCNRSRVQLRLAQAQGKLLSARSFFHDTYQAAWEAADRGDLSLDMKARCQLATTNAVLSCAEAVDLVHACVGTSGIRRELRFEKYFRDVHVVTQHAFLSDARLEAVGQVMFGLEPDWPFFAF